MLITRQVGGVSARQVRGLFGATAMVISIGVLSACGNTSGVNIPLGSDQLEQCSPITIDVGDLSSIGEPECDLVGSTVLLPNGTPLEIDEVGVVASYQSPQDDGHTEHLIVNWGIPGIAVSAIEAQRLMDQWATSPDAAELQRQQLLLEGVKDE